MTTSIYDGEGLYLTQGLQSGLVCDHAIQTARKLAAELGATVTVEDDGLQEVYTIRADGSRGPAPSGWVPAWEQDDE